MVMYAKGATPVTKTLVAILLSIGGIGKVSAAAQELDGPAINNLITGQTVRLNTPIGISLPLRYRSNGVVEGDISGFSAARMFIPREQGRWWIEKNSLCQKWPTWYNGRQFCFKITLLGAQKISWLRDDGFSGTARIGN
jgi:hypothetical protein